MTRLLEVRELSVSFRTTRGAVAAVDSLSFDVAPGEAVAIVGESGCGKSTTALAILRLIPDPPGRIEGGRVLFKGQDLLALDDDAMRAIRGHRIAMIFQDPMMALNPVHRIGDQITEGLWLHLGMSGAAAAAKAADLLRLVGVPAPEDRLRHYPHQLSGGMRQRVMIAMALACGPELLIADEPTTAVDVTVQAQILELLDDLRRKLGMALLLITHDLGVVAETVDRVIVMYAGRKVEEGPVARVLGAPAHPYAEGLLAAARLDEAGRGLLQEIPGTVPSPFEMPQGCAFAPRCPKAISRCSDAVPPFAPIADGHAAACFVAQGGSG